MSTLLFTQHRRLNDMLGAVADKILALATQQRDIYVKYFPINTNNVARWATAGYYTVGDYDQTIECWNSYSGDPDDNYTAFKLSPHILAGQPGLYEAECAAKFGAIIDATAITAERNRLREIAQLESRLAQLRG